MSRQDDLADLLGGDTAVAEPTASSIAVVPHRPPPPIPTPTSTVRPSDVQRILKLPVPVIVELAAEVMPVQKVLEFKVGDIIEFNKPFDAELNLIVADRQVGKGQAVKVNENFGLRVTSIQSISSTIQALGGG